MAIVTANQLENARAIYIEATGDGATSVFSYTHNRYRRLNHTVHAVGYLAGGSVDRHSQGGGHIMPAATPIAITSATIVPSTGVITITTTAPIANGVKGYFSAILNQSSE